jgi:L,D-peptidoglycan transpeptidase YkuD (ErfK/YbiS/YcfS/YnhG family)
VAAATAVVLLVSGLLSPLAVADSAQLQSAAPAYHPSRLAHVGDARQVIVVTATSWSTSYGTLRAYERNAAGRWAVALGPVSARLGWEGFASIGDRKQRSGETPAGTFGLLRAFGSRADPGSQLPYRQFDRNDWWPYDPRDPRTYNVLQLRRPAAAQWRTSWAEHLWDFRDQYAYAVVLDYNLPSGIRRDGRLRVATETADTRAGGGIFLHVSKPRPTAGCVAVRLSDMRQLVRWLDPQARPVIVMAPTSAISRA